MRKRSRTPSPDRASDEPQLTFVEGTPYDAYVGATKLATMQTLFTNEPSEMPFLVVSQIMELYFGLICWEWKRAVEALRDDDLDTALQALKRSCSSIDGLNAAWLSLSWMTPREFNTFRADLGEASGFQSAQYRRMEFLLGNKSRQMLAAHKGNPELHRDLAEALESPSLYDETLAWLGRRGFAIPADVLDRALDAPYEPSDEVEAVWVTIYLNEPAPEIVLAEALTDVAQRISEWKFWHLTAVRRTMGNKEGTGGSSGVAWLERSLAKMPFPEIWTARSQV
ncbi:MAG: tryptophan 2,3-dioxygenase family protein [Actinobacteria bacterium]|nr:tryptophan 2,3-dioxygenase family protein [Actinomycetota bacterium]